MQHEILPNIDPSFFLLGTLCSGVFADERPEHFKGLVPETLEPAVQNLSDYNNRLEDLLAGEELFPKDLATVHELTYTIENALTFIEDEIDHAAVLLEDLHVASEETGSSEVKAKGQAYLLTATQIIQ